MSGAESVKVTVTLPSETVADIKDLATRLGVTPGELLSRAVSIEKYLDDVEDSGGKILVETAGNRINRITRR
jgi:predicted DNA-binding protein